jgi:pantoate kinase
LTEARVTKAEKNDVKVFINESLWPGADTTKAVVRMLLKKSERSWNVVVRHTIDVPIGAGFGSSAAGALGAALALSKALGLSLTLNQLARAAHVADVQCKTGLGTVGPLTVGGCVLTLEPGAPGIAVIDRLPVSADYVIVAGVYGPIPTRSILSSTERRTAVNRWGRKTLDAILSKPSLENFLHCCLEFSEKTGFMTKRLRTLVKLAEEAGAIGAAQNMVGEAVHALTTSENADRVVQAFKRVLPQEKICIANIDNQGARLIG